MEHHPTTITQEERLAARINQTDGVRRHGPAFGPFAEAIGHVRALRDPELFTRSLVGRWLDMDSLVDDFVTESGLHERLGHSGPLETFIGIDRDLVATYLRQELLIVEAGGAVWVFDIDVPDSTDVVKTTVDETQLGAHSG